MFDILKKLISRKKKTTTPYDSMTDAQFVEHIKSLLNDETRSEKDARLAVYERNKRLFQKWKVNDPEHYNAFLNNTKLYDHYYSVNTQGKIYEHTQTGCINADCVDVAESLQSIGYNPAILNLASARNPGGGYHRGTSAQEESLCRRSNLILSLYQYADPQKMLCVTDSGVPVKQIGYPLDINFGGIYTPNVTFFRYDKSNFFAMREKYFQCDVITVAALKFTGHPAHHSEYETQFRAPDGGFTAAGETIMLNKIRTILRMGVEHQKDALVLGAFGCGAYQLPIPDVARLFKTVINEPEFANKFRVLVFAILENKTTKNAENGKFKEFYQEFGTYTPN